MLENFFHSDLPRTPSTRSSSQDRHPCRGARRRLRKGERRVERAVAETGRRPLLEFRRLASVAHCLRGYGLRPCNFRAIATRAGPKGRKKKPGGPGGGKYGPPGPTTHPYPTTYKPNTADKLRRLTLIRSSVNKGIKEGRSAWPRPWWMRASATN